MINARSCGRYDVRYEGTWDRWTERHRAWLAKVELPERGAQATFLDYLGVITALEIRRGTLEATIAELAPASRWAGDIARLRCLRGIDTLSAVGLCAGVGDFARFERPAQLMSSLAALACRPPSTVSHELLSSKHKSSSLAGIAPTAASGVEE